jgi:propanediol dehydratase small subunit
MYGSLRPYRSSKQELLDMADELENKYGATVCANFVREAADEYEKRKKLKGDN